MFAYPLSHVQTSLRVALQAEQRKARDMHAIVGLQCGGGFVKYRGALVSQIARVFQPQRACGFFLAVASGRRMLR